MGLSLRLLCFCLVSQPWRSLSICLQTRMYRRGPEQNLGPRLGSRVGFGTFGSHLRLT